MSPTRRTTPSTSTPTEVTSLGEFQPHFGGSDSEDQKQSRRKGIDLLYKPFPPTTTGFLIFLTFLSNISLSQKDFSKSDLFRKYLGEGKGWTLSFIWQRPSHVLCSRPMDFYYPSCQYFDVISHSLN